MSQQSDDSFVADKESFVQNNDLAGALTYANIADAANTNSSIRIKHYGFNVADYNFLVEQGLYCELLTTFQIAPLPNSPIHFLGLTNVRGNLIPVYQLEPILNITPLKNYYVLVLGTLANAAALCIQNKPQAIDLTDFEEVTPNSDLPELFNQVRTKTYLKENTHWYLFDHNLLLKKISSAVY